MNYDEVMKMDKVEFGDMPPAADAFFKEITWKQFFAIICINLCKEAPTINELSDVMGSSHQNVKQILLRLEKKDLFQLLSMTGTKESSVL